MNTRTCLIAVIASIGIVSVSCTPDAVGPHEGGGKSPSLAGSFDDPHPALDTVCQTSDTLFLVREDDGSPVVNKCYAMGYPIVCPPNQPKWGSLVLVEGYYSHIHFIDCEFTMAPGWYCDFNNWQFGLQREFLFDNNGLPIVGTDWGLQIVNPVENKWKLRIAVSALDTPCFYAALRVHAIKMSLFGSPINGSGTTTWGRNSNWNNPSHPAYSNSPWLMRFCPEGCLKKTSCAMLYNGVPQLGNCATISSSSTLPGNLTYNWSTGAHTPTITVCPTVTTTYTVTISNGPLHLTNAITVNVVNAACGNGNNIGNKVWVCHVPPGNPGNAHDICISWNGVPAHVARFRSPNSNPNQGHDSGCEIGRCGSNICL